MGGFGPHGGGSMALRGGSATPKGQSEKKKKKGKKKKEKKKRKEKKRKKMFWPLWVAKPPTGQTGVAKPTEGGFSHPQNWP
jgi:hypothetical protein